MYKLIWIDEDTEPKVQREIENVLAFDSLAKDDVDLILEQFEEDITLSKDEYDEIARRIDKRDDFPNLQELRDIIKDVVGDRC